jgi:hypothetical protein
MTLKIIEKAGISDLWDKKKINPTGRFENRI